MVAIGLVAGGDDDGLTSPSCDPAGFEQVVGTRGCWPRRWAAGSRRAGADDRLRRQVEDDVGLVLVDGALQRGEVLQAAVDDRAPGRWRRCATSSLLVIAVADQADDPGVAREQMP